MTSLAAEVVVAAVLILSLQAQVAQVAAVVRKYQQTCPESLYCWLPATPSCDTSRSVSSPLSWTFLTICCIPSAVVAGHTEYMSVSEGSMLGPAQEKGGRGHQWWGQDEAVQY